MSALVEPADADTMPIAATLAWCLICREPKPYRNRLMPDVSKQRRAGLHGEHLVCVGCGTTVATIYVEDP